MPSRTIGAEASWLVANRRFVEAFSNNNSQVVDPNLIQVHGYLERTQVPAGTALTLEGIEGTFCAAHIMVMKLGDDMLDEGCEE